MPEELHGKELTLGYTSMTREGHRNQVPFFQANGIAAAAGFSSNVEDLGKFAAWQFRLLDTTTTEILRPSTLKYMQRVHWTDPDWEFNLGAGFFSVQRLQRKYVCRAWWKLSGISFHFTDGSEK